MLFVALVVLFGYT